MKKSIRYEWPESILCNNCKNKSKLTLDKEAKKGISLCLDCNGDTFPKFEEWISEEDSKQESVLV